jgi:4-amino-4-deoxy-L-arabinose transferase-like glycosyltransferase
MFSTEAQNRAGQSMQTSLLQKIESIPGALVVCIAIGVYLLLSFSLFLTWPPPWPDEVWFADVGRTFSTEGYLGTGLIKGMETHMYWQPPVYFVCSALVIKLGGFDIVPLRLFSILVGCGILVLTFALTRRVTQDSVIPKIAVILLALNPNFVNYIKVARMDGLCVLFTIAALIAYVDLSPQSTWKRFLGIGTFLALAILTHALGSIGFVAIAIHLLMSRGRRSVFTPKRVVLLLLPTMLGLALGGLYVLDDPQAFLGQMQLQLQRKNRLWYVSLAHFVERYRSIPTFLAFLLAGCVFLCRRFLKGRSEKDGFILAALFLSLVLVSLTFELPYHLYVLPYGSLAIAIAMKTWWGSPRKVVSMFSFVASAVLVLNLLFYFGYFNVTFHGRLREETDYARLTAKVEEWIPAHSKVCLFGPPSLYWGLRKSGKDLSFVEGVFLDEGKQKEVVKEVQYVILARAFTPSKDMKELGYQLHLLEKAATPLGFSFQHVATIGVRQAFAYSAEVYQVVRASTGQE